MNNRTISETDNFDWSGLYAPENYSKLNILVFSLSKREAYRPILFSSNEIFCSPDCETTSDDEHPRCIKTPSGAYDISIILKQLPGNWKPDLLIVKMDGTRRNIPLGVDKLRCPKIFIVGAPHHLYAPLRCLLDYLHEEKFDFILADHDRHHLHFFSEAGFSNVFWLPAINIYPHLQAGKPELRHDVSLIGNIGRFHPYRRHIAATLRQIYPQTCMGRLPHHEAAATYARSRININCSLNGDMNLRVFEIISSGGFLLTDTLAEASGLEMLFKPGVECETYRDADEMTTKIDHYLAHPDAAAEIAAAGFKRFWQEHDPRLKVKQLCDYVFNGKLDDRYSIALDRRSTVTTLDYHDGLNTRVAEYEFIQDLQLHNRNPQILMMSDNCAALTADLSDLIRTDIYLHGDALRMKLPPEAKAHPLDTCPVMPVMWNCIVINAETLKNATTGNETLEDMLKAFPFDSLIVDGVPDEDTLKMLNAAGLEATWDANIPVYQWVNIALPGKVFIAAHMESALDFLKEKYSGLYHQSKIDFFAGCIWMNSAESRNAGLARLREYLQTDRLDYKTLEILSDNEIQNQHPEAATAYLEDLLKAAPRDWEKMNLTAGVYMQLNDYPRARFWYQRSIEINPVQDAIARKIQRLNSRVMEENIISHILSPSRILVITNLYPPQELGGYGRSMFNFANELRARGHEVRILTSYLPSLDPCPEHEPFIDRSLELFGDWINGQIVNHPEPEPIILKNIVTVTRIIRELKPDFILAGNLNLINYNIIAPILNNFDVPLLHHLGYQDNPFPNHLLPRHPHFFFAGASQWIMQRNITPGYENCDFVYPGAKVRDFMLNTPVSSRRLNIAYASLVSRSKGIGTLVNALSVLKSQGIDFSCTVAGKILDQELYEELLHVSKCNGFEQQITFTGNLNIQELMGLYSRHNVLVFPSINPEAFGITPVEAMAAGLPVISTGQGGAAEVVEDGYSGIITPPGDHNALADALISLLQNPEEWEKMGRAAKRRALEVFDISVSVDKLEKIFKNMIKIQ